MTNLNAEGKIAKHRNHTVPRSLLCEWLSSNSAGREGIHYIDCGDSRLKFEEGRKAKFAISEYLYVPIGTDSYRDERMENWFSHDENALVTLSRETTSRTFGNTMSSEQKGNAIRASIILGYRSHYEYTEIAKIAHSKNSSATPTEIQQEVVSHFWAIYEKKLKQFQHWSFTIFHGLRERLLICDRPLFDLTLHNEPQEMVLIAISPNAFLMGAPEGGKNQATLNWRNASTSNLATFMNHQSIMRARRFLVGDSSQLAAVADQMQQSQIKERMQLDRLI